jgi:hypothetical protein
VGAENVVGSAFEVPVPTKLITAVMTKFAPFTVSVNAVPPGAWAAPLAELPFYFQVLIV